MNELALLMVGVAFYGGFEIGRYLEALRIRDVGRSHINRTSIGGEVHRCVGRGCPICAGDGEA